jgi:endonuclease-3
MTRACLIRKLVETLEALYGPIAPRHPTPILDTLIACILSQHTSDANSGRAYAQLRERFASWREVADADPAEVEAAIHGGGLAHTKTRSIQAVLNAVRDRNGEPDLEWLRELNDARARDELLRLPGVGPKTAAIVLCFAMGRPVLPVDTHVYRVTWRLGLIEKGLSLAHAHEALGALVPSDVVYPFHVSLIRHGRTVCHAVRPACDRCKIRDLCRFHHQ